MISLSKEVISKLLYEWAFQDTERELKQGLPLVGRIKGSNAKKYVRFFSQLPSDEIFPASQALVKRMNQPGLLRQKPVLTSEEEKYVREYLRFGEVHGPGSFRMVVADPEKSTAVRTREVRKILKRLIQERFRPEFGPPERVSGNEWLHEVDAGCIRIRTYLDVGGYSSLNYSHMVVQTDGSPLLRLHLSVLQWMGAASMTRWRVLRAEELMDAADTVFALSEHFVAEMRRLFA